MESEIGHWEWIATRRWRVKPPRWVAALAEEDQMGPPLRIPTMPTTGSDKPITLEERRSIAALGLGLKVEV